MPIKRGARLWGLKQIRDDETGLALIAALLVLALLGSIIAATLVTALNVTRTSTAEYRGSRAFYAAEAGAEAALAQIELALQDGLLTNAELAAIMPPSMAGFEFVEYTVVKEGVSDTITITDGAFAGLYAITQDLKVISRANDESGAYAAVVLGVQAQAIPLFQFASFNEGAEEAYAGSRVDSYGRHHVNGDIYMAGVDIHFHDYLSSPGKFVQDGRVRHKGPSEVQFYMENAAGVDVLVTFDSEDTPDPDQFKAKSETDLDGRLRTSAFGVDSLKLPLPEGVPPLELILPKEASDTEVERVTKFAWQADMYVVVDLGDVENRSSVCGSYSGGPTQWPNITVTRTGGLQVPSDTDKCKIFPFKWEAFYDWREQKWIDIANVDLGELRTWVLADSAGRAPRIIYVEIKDSGTVSVSGITDKSGEGFYFPSLRLRNGVRLHGPLTIGGEYPFYVQGDYNNINKQPAAMYGDYMIALSNQWVDANSPTKNALKSPTVTGQLELFTSVITGQSEGYLGCYHEPVPDPGCIPIPAGWEIPGTINHLESWRGCGGGAGKCMFRLIGSFVTLWYPRHSLAMGPDLGYSHYRSPKRDWSFDFDLLDPANLPPGTPSVGSVFRASFREAY